MTDRRNEGLGTWKQRENHNHMVSLQDGHRPVTSGAVELAYFGGSAFRITSPAGLRIMIDPWRNPPWGNWDWYLFDFPPVDVDIGISTHAHFDHDGLHMLHASVLLDRLIGTYAFADVKLTGIADKHVSDSSHSTHDWAEMTRRLTDIQTRPPDNWRSFDNCIVIVEVAGLRILHWGDNRPDPPETVWSRLGEVDIALLPIDGSQHVLSYRSAEAVASRLKAKLIVPHHYYAWDITTRGSTLLPPDEWVNGRAGSRWLESGSVELTPDYVKAQRGMALCFGRNVAFAKPSTKGGTTGA
ncbi:MBL fold metallo-hydrolase [Rhodopila sp.]|uniref:MBL fold metallo-hydrolase n=1 Tax=Rhodopila sp. TaxID=2480087 RepID=UPI003D11D096